MGFLRPRQGVEAVRKVSLGARPREKSSGIGRRVAEACVIRVACFLPFDIELDRSGNGSRPAGRVPVQACFWQAHGLTNPAEDPTHYQS
jgi:hypothetical protein